MKHSESPRAFYNTVSLYVFPVIDGADLFMSWTEEMVFSTNRARIRLGGESVAQNIIVRYIVLYSRNRANGWVFFNMHTIVPLSSTDTCPSTLVVSNFFFFVLSWTTTFTVFKSCISKRSENPTLNLTGSAEYNLYESKWVYARAGENRVKSGYEHRLYSFPPLHVLSALVFVSFEI